MWTCYFTGSVRVAPTSTGIGQATAMTLARSGRTVFAGMRNLERGGELREIASNENLPITIVQLDVDSDSSVEDAFKHIFRDAGQIDVLINNAGIGARGPIELAPIDSFRKAMETNFFGALRCIKAVVPSMREKRSGCIINISSVAGRFEWQFRGPMQCPNGPLKDQRMPRAGTEPIQRPGFDASLG